MKPYISLVVVCASTVISVGCAYRGAVYSDYNQVALDIRASAASGAPVQVNFGYDQGVFAYVPKQNGNSNSLQGEAVSAISWNNMATELNPTQTSTNSVLRVDAGFISGIAADIASAPANSSVTIVAPNVSNTVSISGDPGARIAAATTVFAPATLVVLPEDIQNRRIILEKKLSTFPSDGIKANQVLVKAGFSQVPPNQAINTLQDQIEAAETDAELKQLENAFNQVQ